MVLKQSQNWHLQNTTSSGWQTRFQILSSHPQIYFYFDLQSKWSGWITLRLRVQLQTTTRPFWLNRVSLSFLFLVIKLELLDPWSLIFGGFPCKDRYSGGLKSWSILVSFMHYSTPCNIRLKTCIYYLFITMTKIWPGYLCIPKVWQDYTWDKSITKHDQMMQATPFNGYFSFVDR